MIDRETRTVASYLLALVALIGLLTYYMASTSSQTAAAPAKSSPGSGQRSGSE